jgi:hypothetical protein
MPTSPLHLILYGFSLLLFGFLLAFSMVIRVIEAGFLLSFISYSASLTGLILGFYGAFGFVRRSRR